MEAIRNKTRDIVLDISLTDVIYGVVFAYGFNYFDLANSFFSYSLLGFTYIILIIDWIYTHHNYWGKEYKKEYLILDLLVLFVFSRLLQSSVNISPQFLYWLGVLFFVYAIWDWIMRDIKNRAGKNWKLVISIDIVAAVLFLVLGFLISSKFINLGSYFTIGVIIVFYSITMSIWFKKEHI